MSALVLPTPHQLASAFGVIEPPPIHIDCEAFQGSLSALFIYVRDHKVDLMGIPLGPICEAYLRYLLESDSPNVESHAVGIAALSRLLEKKAALLVAPECEDEHEEESLFDEEFEPTIGSFLPAIEDLLSKKSEREHLYFRSGGPTDEYELPFEAGNVTGADLARTLERLLSRAKPDPPQPIATRRSLSDQIAIVLRALPETPQRLDEFANVELTRTEVVWWFLALLELIRLGQARVAVVDQEACFCRAGSV